MGTLLHRCLRAAILTLAAAAPALGQRIDPDRIFEVTLEVDGRLMNASIREGSSLRLVLRETDEYHFSPVLQEGQGTRVLVAVSRGAAGEPGSQRVVERVELTPGTPVALRSAPAMRIVLDGIRRANPTTPAGAGSGRFLFASAAAQSGSCWVCCKGACACGVSYWCGHCCTQGCCDPVQPTGNDRTRILTGGARFAGFTGGACARGSIPEPRRTRGPAAKA